MTHSPTPQRLKMYMKSPAKENVSLSLTFLGKKIHSCIDPAIKPSSWETTALPSDLEASMPGSGPGHSQHLILGPEELPGSVPHLGEAVPPQLQCTVHSTHLDKDTESDTWLKKNKVGWNVFKQWMRADRKIGLQGHTTCRVMRTREKPPSQREEEDASFKIFIPYDSAKLCVTQIIEDMEFMKRRHLEIVNELEESYINASKNNQEKMIQKVNAHYQNKLISLRRMLDVYQEMAEKKNIYCEERIKTLKNLNQKHLEEKTALQEKNQADAAKWEREKLEMLELFSTRLDLLHKHQASTLQELQMAREELGSIQEMLKPTCANEETNVTSVMRTDLLQSETEDGGESQSCGGSAELTLEGAQARLESLKENLYKREREITELLQGEREMEREQTLSTAIRIPCTALLRTIIQKAHDIYQNVAEAKLLVDHMVEDNGLELAQAKEVPDQEQMTATNHRHWGEDETDWERLTEEQHTRCTLLQKTEAVHIALECTKKDGTWKLEHNCSGLDEEHCRVLENNNFRIKSLGQQLLQLQTELKQAREETKRITENYNSERIMRKKYFNMVEDMKGKIRVFCRIRPMSEAETSCGSIPVVDCLDDYSVTVETSRGLKEFQFDRVFNPTSSQEDVFQDISRLIQSAIDGYNVCIFAYGQTGSGKTFTMVGDKDLKNPGIMPRTFRTIFHITQENSSKFDFKVSMCMLELYNERLLDLFVSPIDALGKRIEIKKDRKGLVIAHGAETKDAASAEELLALFEQGCCNRHIAATKMNMESSRSHLIVGITMESRNHTNGCVSYGKLSLVDLAGSERVAKTGAKDDQLKEANSINKSLSALGDVISALSTEQAYVPYRNNKLTQFMQDSLGGNAKTLMFVNISPASCNTEETLTSLSYATRVKAITNTAQKNSESKEIAHLKEIILKLKSGQPVDDDV